MRNRNQVIASKSLPILADIVDRISVYYVTQSGVLEILENLFGMEIDKKKNAVRLREGKYFYYILPCNQRMLWKL